MQMSLAFSGDVDVAGSNPTVFYEAFDQENDEIVKGEIKPVAKWDGKRKVSLMISEAVLAKYKHLYLSFKGFRNGDKFSVPGYTLGENGFKCYLAKNHKNGLLEFVGERHPGDRFGNEDNPFDLAKIDSLLKKINDLESEQGQMKADLEKQNIEVVYMKQFRGSFQYGVFLGQSIYFGDLTGNDFIDPQDANTSIGVSLGYNFTNRFSISGDFIYGHLEGREADNVYRSTAYPDRGFHFESPLYEISFKGQYNLNRIGVLNEKGRFTPAISFGLGAFMFNPYVMYQHETWDKPYRISLRDYRVSGADTKTPTYTWCLPVGFHLKTILKQRFMVDMFISWRWTATDLLDDVGNPGVYRDAAWYDSQFGGSTFEGVRRSEIALDLHDSQTPGKYYESFIGHDRGGFNNNDWYTIWGVKVSYIALKKKATQKGGG